MKKMKKMISVILAVLMVLTIFPLSVFAENTSGILYSGYCGANGDNLTWTLYSDGELVIDGEGEMKNYTPHGLWETYSPIPNAKKITINRGVTTIGSSVFEDCSAIESITIPDSVTSIGHHAFHGCSALTSITIPDSVISIGTMAFRNCSSLVSITIPDSVTSIGDYAFGYCDSLTNITIPDSVTNIGDYAFYYCNSLTDVYYSGSEEEWNKIDIGSYNSCLTNATIHFNSGGNSGGNSNVVDEDIEYYIKHSDDDYARVSMKAICADSNFSEDSAVYNHDLACLCSQFTVVGYTSSNGKDEKDPDRISKNQVMKNALKKLGFEKPEADLCTDRTDVNYFIANKKINVNGEEYTLIFTGFIGSYHEQWYSNFDPGTGKTHQGFNGAKTFILLELNKYIKDLNIDKSKTKILITGHSRGAATANLVAADLIKNEQYAYKENIYTYAFATPNSTSLPERKNVEYNRIFNIVNPEDFVTKVLPSNWKNGSGNYGRYGTTYTLPSKTNTEDYSLFLSEMKKVYNRITDGDNYAPYSTGEYATYSVVNLFTKAANNIDDYYNKKLESGIVNLTPYEFFTVVLCPFVCETASAGDIATASFVALDILRSSSIVYKKIVSYFIKDQALNGAFKEAHCAETYCAYMLSMSKSEVQQDRKAYKNTINCPVDVEVIDNTTGDVVARIVNNEIDEEIAAKENSLVVSVDGDSKSVWVPSDGDYDIRLTGNDNGTMDYSVSEISEDSDEVARVNFDEVEIIKDKTLTGTVSSEDFILDEYALTSEDGETIEADDFIDSENKEAFEVSLQTTVDGNGFASGDGVYTKGDYVTVGAVVEEENSFIGWFENGELISTEIEYSFVIKTDKTITAKFSSDITCVCGSIFDSEEALSIHIQTCCVVKAEHNYSATVTSPTCAEKGYTVYTCSCGDTYVSDYIDETGHKEEIIPGKTSTCTSTGLSDGKKCSVCGEILVAQEEIPATEHTPGEWEVVTPAQVGIEGKEQQKCTVCDKVLDERIIPALSDDTFMSGDANGDGKVNAADARIILRISAQLEKIDKYSQPFEAFDVNGDGKINASDARKVLRISAKLES